MAESIALQLATLQHDAIVELFVLDLTSLGGDVLHFHNGTNKLDGNVVWQGQAYQRYAIDVEGFEIAGDGPIARPTLKVANVFGLVGVLIRQYNGLKGAQLIRKRTLAKYLDAVNFPGGVNATADPTTHFADDVYNLDRLVGRDGAQVVYELASPLDVADVKLPRGQVLHFCPGQVVYRGTGCGYAGPPVAKEDDSPTALLAEDRCGHRLSSCRLRQWPDGVLNFGGFPGAGVIRNA